MVRPNMTYDIETHAESENQTEAQNDRIFNVFEGPVALSQEINPGGASGNIQTMLINGLRMGGQSIVVAKYFRRVLLENIIGNHRISLSWADKRGLNTDRVGHGREKILRNYRTYMYTYNNATANVRVSIDQSTDKFDVDRGVRQGDTLSPKLFVALMESMLKRVDWGTTGVNIDGEQIGHLCFADDIVLITNNIRKAQYMLDMQNDVSEKFGLKMNLSKTQYMTNLVLSSPLKVNNINLEQMHI
ncbi:uncharacterized protein LOC123675477 [Harmonia axyridis]|uniref:uncharacterized protein LOC123675477 n=1 Tax=Harmonia axyridis TaxID=115357 RepID=UPI001E2789C1|nr:uncharacterized protein LOC123675477 [Harmonia axyridis]